MSRRALLIVLGIGLLGIVAGAAVFGRSRFRPQPTAAPPVSTKPVPPVRVYQEKIEGRSYANRDLGLALQSPKDWTVSLGSRSDDRPPYEGLVVKMTPASAVGDSAPIVSVMKQSLPGGASQDPLDFIRRQLLSERKSVTEEPRKITISGRPAARVAYRMGALQAVQVVRVTSSGAVIVTAVAPADRYPEFQGSFEEILSTLSFES